jgi:isopenicillin N synthase-like dioxygenase
MADVMAQAGAREVAGGGLGAVPVIDIAGYFSGDPARKRAIARAIDAAGCSIGFLVIAGHGVPDALIARLDASARAYFALPPEAKRRDLTRDPAVYRGYYEMGSSAVAYAYSGDERDAAAPDYVERFSINRVEIDGADPYYQTEQGRRIFAPNIWPATVPGFERAWTDYYHAMESLAQTLMRLFALALDLDEHWFDDKIDKHMTNMSANWYPDQVVPPMPGQLRIGAHTDYGSLTILKAEDKPGGLEVRARDGSWLTVPIVPGTLIVNLGDLMAQWTNDRWVSTLHRVVNPPRDRVSGTARLSVAFFHQPNYDALVECLPGCREGGVAKYPPVTSGDHLTMKLTKMQQVRA